MKPKKIIKHETYVGMYRLYYGKGMVSDNFWNISRANDILNRYDEYVNNTAKRVPRKPVHKSLEVES
jgi:hypothetical protein